MYACTSEANRPNVQFVQGCWATLPLYLPLVQLLQVLWAVLSWYCPRTRGPYQKLTHTKHGGKRPCLHYLMGNPGNTQLQGFPKCHRPSSASRMFLLGTVHDHMVWEVSDMQLGQQYDMELGQLWSVHLCAPRVLCILEFVSYQNKQ